MKRIKTFFAISLGVCLLSCLLFFTALDSKLFDVFLRFLPPLEENEKVVVLALDDASMEFAGGFPFRREVMADVVILLKELGVQEIVFDLSYLDESAKRFDPAYAIDSFIRRFNSNNISLQDAVSVIPHIGRDVDDYFARALAFSDNSWLTLTMFSADILDDIENIKTDEETDNYLKQIISAQNVINKGDSKTPDAVRVMPAIQKLLDRVIGAGFVNADPDTDGLRRRVHLLWKYQDNYYKQLTLAAIQEMLGYNEIEVTNRDITLNKNDGSKIKIHRAQNGSVLIKWPNKSFNDYNMMSLVPLIQYTTLEPFLAENIAIMDEFDFFYCWEEEFTPWDCYITAQKAK